MARPDSNLGRHALDSVTFERRDARIAGQQDSGKPRRGGGVVVDDEGLEVVAGVEERGCLDALEEKLTKLQLE